MRPSSTWQKRLSNLDSPNEDNFSSIRKPPEMKSHSDSILHNKDSNAHSTHLAYPQAPEKQPLVPIQLFKSDSIYIGLNRDNSFAFKTHQPPLHNGWEVQVG